MNTIFFKSQIEIPFRFFDYLEQRFNVLIYLQTKNQLEIDGYITTNLENTINALKWFERIDHTFAEARDGDKYHEMIQKARKHFKYQEFDVSGYSTDAIKKTIGRDGYYFIIVTEVNGLNFIWHNKERKVIEFWGGGFHQINKAKMSIIKKLNFHNNHVKFHFVNPKSPDNKLYPIPK